MVEHQLRGKAADCRLISSNICERQFLADPQVDESPRARSNWAPLWFVLCLVVGAIGAITTVSCGGTNPTVQRSSGSDEVGSAASAASSRDKQNLSTLRVGAAVVKIGDLADDIFPIVNSYKASAPQTHPDPTNPDSLAVTHTYVIDGATYGLEFRRREDPGPYRLFAIYRYSHSNPPKRNAAAERSSSASSSAVEGLTANWLLAQESEKHRRTVEALSDAKGRGDFKAFAQILQLRSRELAQAIETVKRGSYSITNKRKVLNVLEQEKEWADSGAEALSQN
jgi:hypothetical protein